MCKKSNNESENKIGNIICKSFIYIIHVQTFTKSKNPQV